MTDTVSAVSKEYLMYMHAGSGNHGCEAIVRSLTGILGGRPAVLSNNPGEDERAGLGEICDVIPAGHYEDSLLLRTKFYIHRRLTGRADAQMDYAYRSAAPYDRYRMALSVGGDNYCYDDALVNLRGANQLFAREHVPTALVGCSVEPKLLERPGIVEDLSLYSCIIARESDSYRALREGLPPDRAERVSLLPDPAFLLKKKECALPEGFRDGHTIGINISPMILNYESPDDPGIILRNYKHLIETILNETHDVIMLIPHVVTPYSDDTGPIRTLYDMYADSGRVIMVSDAPAEELKYMISRCRLLIAARTHASIAAYSTYVPTLVVGYSVKALGIARDLFGTDEGYVCPVQGLKTDSDLTDAYTELEAYAGAQKDILMERMPEWTGRAAGIAGILNGL